MDAEGKKLKLEWAQEVVKRAERDLKNAHARVREAEAAERAAQQNLIEVQREVSDFVPHVETHYWHEGGFWVDYWRVTDVPDPIKFEYRIVDTTMVVREEAVPNYGACYSMHCGLGPHERNGLRYGFFPAQVGATRRLGDAWAHWQEHHVKERAA